MNGGTISGSGVDMRSGSFIMNGGNITLNPASENYWGIVIGMDILTDPIFTMNRGNISNARILTLDGGTIIINDGNITDSLISISDTGILTMNGGTISSSIIGREHFGSGTFTMHGGTISDSEMYIGWENGIFTMNSGVISSSIILVKGRGIFNMNGGSIVDGSVGVGGVYITSSGMSSNSDYGGVYTSGIFRLKGNASVSELVLYIISDNNITNNASIKIASGWTGVINSLNLSHFYSFDNSNSIVDLWANKTVIQADTGYNLTVADLARISLNHFIDNNYYNIQLINGNTDGKTNYNLALENNTGVLKALP
jgi:hypothetical protein